MAPQNVAFGIIAAAMVISALRVVTTDKVVHSALYLVVVLAGVAALYLLLAAEFVAWAQVLIYIGAILVLLIFGVMLTKAPLGASDVLDNDQKWAAGLVALGVLGLLVGLLADEFGSQKIEPTTSFTSAAVGDSIFREFVVPFEVVSMLLLAALVGAVVLARRDD